MIAALTGVKTDMGEVNLPASTGVARLWLELVAATVLGVLGALFGISAAVQAVGPRLHSGITRLDDRTATVIVCLAVLVLCARWAVSIESRLRRNQPAAKEYARLHEADPRPASRVRALIYRRPRYGPVSAGVITALFGLLTVGLAVGAILYHSQADRSSLVQHHGTRAIAIVFLVGNRAGCTRRSCTDTAAILARLSPPVDGSSGTIVHYPAYSPLVPGDHVTVLVDPKDPGYAEIPGATFERPDSWIVLAVLTLLFGALAVSEGRALRPLLAHRRAIRAVP
jgi:predicted anti-sigma-YlaC factor YlaD